MRPKCYALVSPMRPDSPRDFGAIQIIYLLTYLYGSETWTLHEVDSGRIQSFHMQALSRILGIRWYDKVSNEVINERTKLPDLPSLIVMDRKYCATKELLWLLWYRSLREAKARWSNDASRSGHRFLTSDLLASEVIDGYKALVSRPLPTLPKLHVIPPR